LLNSRIDLKPIIVYLEAFFGKSSVYGSTATIEIVSFFEELSSFEPLLFFICIWTCHISLIQEQKDVSYRSARVRVVTKGSNDFMTGDCYPGTEDEVIFCIDSG
jgi:hypothetical protein